MAELREGLEVKIGNDFGIIKKIAVGGIIVTMGDGKLRWVKDGGYVGGLEYAAGELVEVKAEAEVDGIQGYAAESKIVEGHVWHVINDGTGGVTEVPHWEIRPVERSYTIVAMMPEVGAPRIPGNADVGDCTKTAVVIVRVGRTLQEACGALMRENLTVAVFEGSGRIFKGETEAAYQERLARYAEDRKALVRPEVLAGVK